MPRVFYGKEPESTRPIAPGEASGTGSEAETDVEPGVRLKRGLHKRSETVTIGDGVAKKRKSGTKGSSRDASGRAPLQRACVKGSFERVKELLDAGADPEDRDYAGTTALHSAALQGDVSIVRALLDAGAQANARSGPDEQDTPLMDAAAHGQVEVVELLLSRGADARITNTDGRTALDFALDFGDVEDEEEIASIVNMLRNNIAEARRSGKAPPPPPTLQASSAAAQSPLPDVTTRSGRAEVARRAAQGDMASVGLALEQGWQPTAEALVQAAKFGHDEVVGLLLAFGLSPDVEYEGETALHATLGRGHVQTVKLLLDSGASRNWRDQKGRSYASLVADFPADDPERILFDPDAAQNVPPSIPAQTKSTDTKDTQVKNAQVKDTQVKDTQVKDTQVKDTQVKDAQVKDTQVKEEHDEPKESRKDVEAAQNKPERAPSPASVPKERHSAAQLEPLHIDRTREPKRKPSQRSGEIPSRTTDDSSVSPRHLSPGAPKQQAPVISTGASTRLKAGFKPRERESVHVLPSAPPPDPAEIQALEELARRKERERHQREAKMLEALAKRHREPIQRENTASPPVATDVEPKETQDVVVPDVPPASAPAPIATAVEEERDMLAPLESREDTQQRVSVAGLPRALRELAVDPKPTDAALPLLVYTDANSKWVLDVQAAVALGKPRLHAEHPDWKKHVVPEPLKQLLWSAVQPWLGRDEQERELFLALPVAFVHLNDVESLFDKPPPVVEFEPSLAQTRPFKRETTEYSQLPFRLSMKLRAQREQYKW